MKKYLLSVCLALALSGCATHLGEFSYISNKSVNLKNYTPKTKAESVVGKSDTFYVLGIRGNTPSLQDALNDALRKGNGDLMKNASLYETGWTLLLFGQYGYEIRGEVINTQE